MLFRFAANLSLGEVLDWSFVGAYLAATLTIYLLATGVALARRVPAAEAAFEAQCAVIGNIGFLGLPMLGALMGDRAIIGIMQMLAVDLIVFSSLIVVIVTGSKEGRVRLATLGTVGLGLVQNPMIVAIVLGLGWSALALPVPAPMEEFLTILGAAATPGALFAIGASLAGKHAVRLGGGGLDQFPQARGASGGGGGLGAAGLPCRARNGGGDDRGGGAAGGGQCLYPGAALPDRAATGVGLDPDFHRGQRRHPGRGAGLGDGMVIYVDADACPVKAEVEVVASRLKVRALIVSNGGIRPSANPLVEMVYVPDGPDVADIWIAERAGPGDVVVTGDIPLAAKCVAAGARVVKHNGEPLTPANIGNVLAGRDLAADLGPPIRSARAGAGPLQRPTGPVFWTRWTGPSGPRNGAGRAWRLRQSSSTSATCCCEWAPERFYDRGLRPRPARRPVRRDRRPAADEPCWSTAARCSATPSMAGPRRIPPTGRRDPRLARPLAGNGDAAKSRSRSGCCGP